MKRLFLFAGIFLALTAIASNNPAHAHASGVDCKVPIIVSN